MGRRRGKTQRKNSILIPGKKVSFFWLHDVFATVLYLTSSPGNIKKTKSITNYVNRVRSELNDWSYYQFYYILRLLRLHRCMCVLLWLINLSATLSTCVPYASLACRSLACLLYYVRAAQLSSASSAIGLAGGGVRSCSC